MPTFATPGPVTATVEVAGAQVRVTASDRTDAVVRVQLDRVDALRASISAGEVEIGHIAGRADIDGASFAVRIGEVEGPAVIASAGGRTWIGHAASGLELCSSSGSLDIDRADGSVTATTASGAIRIGRMTRGQAKLMNGSANIEVGVSDGAAAYLDVTSERGSVHNSVVSLEDQNAPEAEVTVRARTRYGDVIVHRVAR
jgi:hypothetical protein